MEVRLGPLWKEGEVCAKSLGATNEGKGIFLLLSSLSLALLLGLLWILFYLLEPRVSALGARFAEGMAISFGVVGLAAAVLVTASLASAVTGSRLVRGSSGRTFIRSVILPVSEQVGRLFGVPSDRVKGSFVEFNNAIVRTGRVSCRVPGEVLLLLPHCLQSSECSRMLAGDVQSCVECGSCAMSELKQLVVEYRVQNRIVGGGALALMAVRELRPRAVVGVACPRELVAAIKELKNIPVVAVSNSRPEGPCRNTKVEVSRVEEALRIFLKL